MFCPIVCNIIVVLELDISPQGTQPKSLILSLLRMIILAQ